MHPCSFGSLLRAKGFAASETSAMTVLSDELLCCLINKVLLPGSRIVVVTWQPQGMIFLVEIIAGYGSEVSRSHASFLFMVAFTSGSIFLQRWHTAVSRGRLSSCFGDISCHVDFRVISKNTMQHLIFFIYSSFLQK